LFDHKFKGRNAMEQAIRARYNDTILQEALRRYRINSNQLQPLDGMENFVYAFAQGQEGYILRISHTLHRSEALIRGEVDWLHYLAAQGISVAQPICSATDQLVEVIDDGAGGKFLVTAFTKAPGQPPDQVGWTTHLHETYGNLLGSLHAATQSYEPADMAWRRPQWDDDCVEVVDRYLPATETRVKQKYHALRAYVRTLPKTQHTYGLIHQDAHGGNFFVDEAGRITLFDFDDCLYSWFISDIAFVLFAYTTNAPDAALLTQQLMVPFLQGYRQAHALDAHWLKEIPIFLKLWEIQLYAVLQRELATAKPADWWGARYLQGRKEKIEQDLPYIDFDFATLAAYL